MELTKRESVEKSIELWTWLAGTGALKQDWPGWKGIEEGPYLYCFMCEYSNKWLEPYDSLNDRCFHCPYHETYGEQCYGDDNSYDLWEHAETSLERKRYAKKFLKELYGVLEELEEEEKDEKLGKMKEEVLTSTVEIDIGTLNTARSHKEDPLTETEAALYRVLDAVIDGLDLCDTERLEEAWESREKS